jgi:hypothetical protein
MFRSDRVIYFKYCLYLYDNVQVKNKVCLINITKQLKPKQPIFTYIYKTKASTMKILSTQDPLIQINQIYLKSTTK